MIGLYDDGDLASLVVSNGLATDAQVQQARKLAAEESRGRLATALLAKKVVDRSALVRVLRELCRHQFKCRGCRTRFVALPREEERKLACAVCGKWNLVPKAPPVETPPSTERVVVRPVADPESAAEAVPDDDVEWDLPDDEDSPLASGSRFGPYEIQGELARGAMGILYRARETRKDGRLIALKVLQRKLEDDEEHVQRFRREAEALGRLDHPNVVRVHDAGELDGRRFFTMELVEGETLEEKIANAPLEAREAARILATVARGLAHLHSRGVLHRDLKLANILVGKDGQARIADFGLARMLDDRRTRLTLDGDLLGTPLYMAPEQVRGELDLDSRVDVYGIGVMLFRLVTKKYPFPAGTAAQLHARILTEPPQWPDGVAVDAEVKKIVECALAKERDDRYPTAAAIATDLEAFVAGKPVRARGGKKRAPEEKPRGWLGRVLSAFGLSG